MFVVVAPESYVPITATAARYRRFFRCVCEYRLQELFLTKAALVFVVRRTGGHRRIPMYKRVLGLGFF